MLDVVRIPSVSCAHREHISRCTALRLVSCARLVWIPRHDVAIGPDQALLTKLAGIARKACHADALSLAVA